MSKLCLQFLCGLVYLFQFLFIVTTNSGSSTLWCSCRSLKRNEKKKKKDIIITLVCLDFEFELPIIFWALRTSLFSSCSVTMNCFMFHTFITFENCSGKMSSYFWKLRLLVSFKITLFSSFFLFFIVLHFVFLHSLILTNTHNNKPSCFFPQWLQSIQTNFLLFHNYWLITWSRKQG